MRAAVVGCGFSGLSCALRLLEAGFEVTVVAREKPGDTVSAVAGGLWLPYRVGPEEKAGAWGAATYRALEAMGDRGVGVTMIDAAILSGEPLSAEPWWASALPPGRIRPVDPRDLPHGYADGRVIHVPLVETPAYLAALLDRFRTLGGRLELREVAALAEVGGAGTVVINCAGLGARELTSDTTLQPIRGVVVRVQPRRGSLLHARVDENGPNGLAYVLPRYDACILGGTAEPGTCGDEPTPDTVAGILERCRRIEPALEGAEPVDARCGIRPARPAVRLELDLLDDGTPLIHNYGHGGGGLTLSWGCADEVAQLARSAMS